jgi:hypothetical protein
MSRSLAQRVLLAIIRYRVWLSPLKSVLHAAICHLLAYAHSHHDARRSVDGSPPADPPLLAARRLGLVPTPRCAAGRLCSRMDRGRSG